MVLYFSGTGNTKFVAEYIADKTDDKCFCLNDILKSGKSYRFSSQKPFVVAAPIYAWRFPLVIEEFLKRAKFRGNPKIYFVATMGSQTGNCQRYLEEISQRKKMEFMGFCGVEMPDNYVVAGKMPDSDECEKYIEKAVPVLDDICERILLDVKIQKTDKTPFPSLLSGGVNFLFNKLLVNSKGFHADDGCISCGKCEQICPVNNIKINSGKPEFEDKCVNCYACIHRCPQQAINIRKLTQKSGRYVCVEYSDWKKQKENYYERN